jgi:hypothetical protein
MIAMSAREHIQAVVTSVAAPPEDVGSNVVKRNTVNAPLLGRGRSLDPCAEIVVELRPPGGLGLVRPATRSNYKRQAIGDGSAGPAAIPPLGIPLDPGERVADLRRRQEHFPAMLGVLLDSTGRIDAGIAAVALKPSEQAGQGRHNSIGASRTAGPGERGMNVDYVAPGQSVDRAVTPFREHVLLHLGSVVAGRACSPLHELDRGEIIESRANCRGWLADRCWPLTGGDRAPYFLSPPAGLGECPFRVAPDPVPLAADGLRVERNGARSDPRAEAGALLVEIAGCGFP